MGIRRAQMCDETRSWTRLRTSSPRTAITPPARVRSRSFRHLAALHLRAVPQQARGRVPSPAVRESDWLAAEQRSVGVFGLRTADVGQLRNDLHRTRTPPRLWFAAAWEMTSQKHGVSALGIQRSLGLGSHRRRGRCCTATAARWYVPGRERLTCLVEVDEAHLGGVEGGVVGRQTDTKAIVAIAVDPRDSGGFDCNASTTSPRTA